VFRVNTILHNRLEVGTESIYAILSSYFDIWLFQVEKKRGRQRKITYIDGQALEDGNWMAMVNSPPREDDASLFSFQYVQDIYYKATRDIFPGEEITVWYGDPYSLELGLEVKSQGRFRQHFRALQGSYVDWLFWTWYFA